MWSSYEKKNKRMKMNEIKKQENRGNWLKREILRTKESQKERSERTK